MKNWVFGAAAGLVTFGAPAVCAELKPPPGAFVPADWKRKPSQEELLTVFPAEAFKRGIDGKAVISCNITTQGALNGCTVVSESPAGKGFGAAAIALTPQFMMRPATLNGVAVASTVRMPINFYTNGAGEMASGGKKVIQPNVAWSQAPSYADVVAAYPKKARDARVGGRATIACLMGEDGRLKSCVRAISEPRGYGFDIAAKQLAQRFQILVNSEEGRKATHSLTVHLPFTFDPEMLVSGEPVVGKPNWASLPSSQQMSGAFASLKLQGTTRATIACRVEQEGRLSDCSVVSEAPLGAGVGAAALSLTPAFRMTTWTTEGLPTVGGRVRIPIRYEAGGPPVPEAQTATTPK